MNYVCYLCAGVLCVAEEGETDYVPAHVSPYSNADYLLGMYQVLSWGSWHLYWSRQLICPHHHVLLLHDVCHGTAVSQVPVVEEIHHNPANGATLFNPVFSPCPA
jgi:hypothetical protein